MIKIKEREFSKKIYERSKLFQQKFFLKISPLLDRTEINDFSKVIIREQVDRTFSYDYLVIKDEYFENVDLTDSIENTVFYNCVFKQCSFGLNNLSNTKFIDCVFVKINNCDSVKSYKIPKVISKCVEISGSLFIDSLISFEFSESVINGCLVIRSGLISFSVSNSEFTDNYLFECDYSNTIFKDANICDTVMINNGLSDIKFDDVKLYYNTYLGLSKHLYLHQIDCMDSISDYTFRDFLKHDYYKLTGNQRMVKYQNYYLAQMGYYKSLSGIYQQRNSLTHSGDYNYYRRKSEMFGRSSIRLKFSSFIAWITCGFGERPMYSITNSIIIIIIFAAIYTQTGIIVSDQVLVADGLNNAYGIIIDTLLFSFTTFVSLGYGYMSPIGASKVVSIVEMVLGVLLIGLWIASLTKKMLK